MTRRHLLAAWLPQPPESFPDIRGVEPDLTVPILSAAAPGPGVRVTIHRPGFGREIYHVLYLPRDWRPHRRYPVIVEYAGNGNYSNQFGDVSTGKPEGSNLGYGISGGAGFIWLCLPYIDPQLQSNALTWWGSPEATLDYAAGAIKETCERFGGDPSRVLLCGFSRGSIACNYLGLRNAEIARMWRAFVCYSHYDGVRAWPPYPDSDHASARARLERLGNRPQFICHERHVDDTRRYLAATGIHGNFTLAPLPYRNHNDAWTLRPLALRKTLRDWVRRALA